MVATMSRPTDHEVITELIGALSRPMRPQSCVGWAMPAREPPNFLIDAKPLELTDTEQGFADQVARNVTEPESSSVANPAIAKLDAFMVAARAKEAGEVLSWLSANGYLHSEHGPMSAAYDAIERGDHRTRGR